MTEQVWPASQDPSDTVSRYTNTAYIAMSQWDLTIDFRLASPAPGTPVDAPLSVTHEVARIVMSPTHAKVLAKLIGDAVSKWEATFGDLPDAAKLLPAVADPGEQAPGEQDE